MSAALDWRGEIGNIGEHIVYNLLKRETDDVEFSEDKYDPRKDMMASALSIEVKTLVLIKKYQAFTVGSNQIVKCINVDRLFFVEIANGDYIRVYESPKPRRPFSKLFNGDTCYFFKLIDLILYDTIHDREMAARLRALTPSKYL